MASSSRLLLLVLFAMTLFADAPLRAADLAVIERTIGRQPAYRTEPRYCLLLFGAEAKIRVWIVEDGRTLYVDRNANGDLTDDGPPLKPTEVRDLGSLSGGPPRWDYDYVLDEIKPDTGPAQTKFRLARWNYGEKEDSYGLSVTLHDSERPLEKTRSDPSAGSAVSDAPDSGIPMYAGWFGTLWADSPAKASIIHFGGPLEPRLLREKEFVVDSGVRRLSVCLITPGLGDARREGVEGGEPQPDVFQAAGRSRSPPRSGALSGPARMRHEGLPAEGDRIRPAAPGPCQHLDNAALHAPRRPRACGRAGFGEIMADGYSAIGRSA